MFKYLNKRISTPIAIGIILILVILVGGFTWWQCAEIDFEIDEEGLKIESKKPFLLFKSCSQLIKLHSAEFGKLDFSCTEDADCIIKRNLSCGGMCINKESNTEKYESIGDRMNVKNCLGDIAFSCLLTTGCKCINNQCASLHEGHEPTFPR